MGVITDGLEAHDRLAKRRQPFDDDGFDDREVGVVVVVHEDVAHSRNLIPRDVRLTGKAVRIDVLDRLTDLHQSRATRVVDNAVVQIAISDLVAYGFDGILDVV